MERHINKKLKAQYLTLLVKKISQGFLSVAELESFQLLKEKVDAESQVEKNLSNAWEFAEKHDFVSNS